MLKYFFFALISFVSAFALYWDLMALTIFDKHYPEYTYMQIGGIRIMYWSSTIIILLALFLIFRITFNKAVSKNFSYKVVIIICSLIITFLVWYELYYGSLFYYGEIRDKQSLPYHINSYGIIGSSTFITYCLTFLNFSFIKNESYRNIAKLFSPFLFYYLILKLQLLICKYLEEPWRLFLS